MSMLGLVRPPYQRQNSKKVIMMSCLHYRLVTVILSTFLVLLGGCANLRLSQQSLAMSSLEEMEAFALCQTSEQGITAENKVRAEYGFKRLAGGAYRPVIKRRLFGHEIRVVELNPEGNKIYASGEPQEFIYNFKQLLPEISCEGDTCQAPLANAQSLLIYKAKFKKTKDTTVIECTKPLEPETE